MKDNRSVSAGIFRKKCTFANEVGEITKVAPT